MKGFRKLTWISQRITNVFNFFQGQKESESRQRGLWDVTVTAPLMMVEMKGRLFFRISLSGSWSKSHGGPPLIAYSTYSLRFPCTSFVRLSWSYKTLEREHFCYIFLVQLEAEYANQMPLSVRMLHLLPAALNLCLSLPAETRQLWVFFSPWLIGTPACTPSEEKKKKKTVCWEEGNQCDASHLSADFFISCN